MSKIIIKISDKNNKIAVIDCGNEPADFTRNAIESDMAGNGIVCVRGEDVDGAEYVMDSANYDWFCDYASKKEWIEA